jgi:hypothetical protein
LNRDTLNHVNPKSVVRNPKIKPFVENVVSRCLDCGDLAEGFARICCENCKNSMLLPFSSKGRWFCRSCHEKALPEGEAALQQCEKVDAHSACAACSTQVQCFLLLQLNSGSPEKGVCLPTISM